jgi:3'(2'), 5'-bisphosphate nucleotidase
LKKLTPVIPVVSEEDAASHQFRTPTNRFWLLDPVDGTREFINRTDEFTVNVALVDAGFPVFGVVLAPAKRELFWGGVMGAWLEDGKGRRTIETAPFPKREPSGGFETALRIVASRSHLNTATREHIAPLQPQQLVNTGSSLKFCRIAQGAADYYPRLGPTCEWDTAAAQAVVEAAGGQVLTLDGQRLNYGKQDVLNPFFLVTGEHAKPADTFTG